VNLLAFAREAGRRSAFARFKLAAPEPPPTHPTVQRSALLSAERPKATLSSRALERLQPPTDPQSVKQIFGLQAQTESRLNPSLKVAAEPLCTTCRRSQHYGPCPKPDRTRPAGKPIKRADFNMGLRGDDPSTGSDNDDGPSTSPHYHSAVIGDSSLARARDGRPADEQAATGFADLFRHLGITAPADEWTNATSALDNKRAGWLLPGSEGHSSSERRGPAVNPYEERLTVKSPPVGWGDEGIQRIRRAFDQIDGAADATAIEGNSQPADGPSVLA
jgi:hypothetical protein